MLESSPLPRHGTLACAGMTFPSGIFLMLRSPTYIGEHVFESTHGEVSRQVPPLVPQALCEAAQAQIEKNRHRAKSNATRSYLLRGLIVCAHCRYYYVGQELNTARARTHTYYRLGIRLSSSRSWAHPSGRHLDRQFTGGLCQQCGNLPNTTDLPTPEGRLGTTPFDEC